MANRAVVVDLLVRTGQFTTGMRRASADMASETTNMQTKTRALQSQIGLLGVAMTAVAAIAVVKWAQFDKAMARVEATGGEAAARIDELNEAAKSDEVIALGYSATEASDAIYELTKAGVSATDIIGGGMSGAMSLAAAETMDAAESASIMASALTQFNLEGKDASHVADLITAAAGKAQGSAHDLGFALKQSGLVANQFGMSIEETTGTLALFASAGLIGSDAGTSLRTMLLHLAGPSTKAAKLMEEIELDIYGANGQMVDMETLANNLQTSLGGLTEQQRNQALATIFGADATRAASLLYREGGDAVVDWTEKVNDAGYAQEVARKRMDNLAGDVKKLSATWERSMINMGESADGALRGLIQNITKVVDWFGDLDPAIQKVIMALTGGGGLAILAVLGIGQIVGALSTLQAGLVATGILTQATANKMALAIGTVTKALGVIALAVTAAITLFTMFKTSQDALKISTDSLADSYDVATGKFNESAKALASDQLFKQFNWWDKPSKGFDSIAQAAEYLGVNLSDLTDAMLNNEEAAARVMASIGDFDPNSFNQDTINDRDLIVDRALNGYRLIDGAIKDNVQVTEESIVLAEKEAEAKKGQIGQTEELADGTEVLTEAQQESADAQAAVTAAEVEAQKAHEQYLQSIVESFVNFSTLGDVYQNVIDKQKEWATSSAEATESSEDSWEDFYDGQKVTAGQYIAELKEQVEAQEEWAANMTGVAERMRDELPASLQIAAQEMIAELRNLGPEGAAQVALMKDMSEEELKETVDLFRRQGVAAGEMWAEEVEAAEAPEVDIDAALANEKLDALQTKVDNAAGQHVTIPFSADTHGAMTELDRLQLRINQVMALSFVIPIGATAAHAAGGPIVGPGTGTSDSIPALLSNGEHVLTADDVQKAGGQSGVYRMRSAIQSGMLRFASGGAVGGHSLEYWQDHLMNKGEIIGLRIKIRDLKKDMAVKGKEALTGLDREKAAYELWQAEEQLRKGLYAYNLNASKSIASRIAEQEAKDKAAQEAKDKAAEEAKEAKEAKAEKAADEKERKGRVAEDKSEYSTDIRRGEFKEGMTGGLDGVYSSLDALRNDVLPDLVGPEKNALAAAIAAAEKNAKKLYKELDGVDKKLEKATARAEKLQAISDGVKSGLVGGFQLSDVASAGKTGAVNPFTGEMTSGGVGSPGKDMLRAAQAYAGKVKIFAGKLKKLADKGFAGVILQEIAAMGVDAGIPAADALLSLNASDTKAMNKAYKDIASFSGKAGQAVTEGFYEGGLAAADGIVAGLEAKRADIQEAIMHMAMDMQNGLKAALGIKSPSRKFRAMMKYVGDGVALGLDDQSGTVADASGRLFAGVSVPGYSMSYGAGGSASSGGGGITANLSDAQVERLAVAFETGNVRNINAATAQQNQKAAAAYGARGR